MVHIRVSHVSQCILPLPLSCFRHQSPCFWSCACLQSTPPNRSPPLNVGSSQCVSTHRPSSVLPVQPTCGHTSGLLRPLVDISASRPCPRSTHPHCPNPKVRKETSQIEPLHLVLALQSQDASILCLLPSKFRSCFQRLLLTIHYTSYTVKFQHHFLISLSNL